MSMIVHFRPLPPDDGAEVPLDLHDPRVRQYIFRNRFRLTAMLLQRMLREHFGPGRTPQEIGSEEWLEFFREKFGNVQEEAELAELTEMAADHLRHGPRDGWPLPTKLESMAAKSVGYSGPEDMDGPEDADGIPRRSRVLLATSDGRWVERQNLGIEETVSKEVMREGKRYLIEETEYRDEYREVNRFAAAQMFVRSDAYVSSGSMPRELEPYRDLTKAPREAFKRSHFRDENGQFYDRLDEYAAAELPELAAAPPSGDATAAANGRTNEAPAELTPPARALAAAYDLQREGKPISLKAACERAGVDRKNLRKLYPEAARTIAALAAPDRMPRRAIRDHRTRNLDALDETED